MNVPAAREGKQKREYVGKNPFWPPFHYISSLYEKGGAQGLEMEKGALGNLLSTYNTQSAHGN